MRKYANNEELKKKLMILLESGDMTSINQAISLNETLKIMPPNEITPFVNRLLAKEMSDDWNHPLWKKVDTHDAWQKFLESLNGDSGPTQDEWTPSNEVEGWNTSDYPFNLDGYMRLPKAKKGMSVADYGKLLGKYIIDLEKKVMAWIKTRPEVTFKNQFVWGGREVLGSDDVAELQISVDVDINLSIYIN